MFFSFSVIETDGTFHLLCGCGRRLSLYPVVGAKPVYICPRCYPHRREYIQESDFDSYARIFSGVAAQNLSPKERGEKTKIYERMLHDLKFHYEKDVSSLEQ